MKGKHQSDIIEELLYEVQHVFVFFGGGASLDNQCVFILLYFLHLHHIELQLTVLGKSYAESDSKAFKKYDDSLLIVYSSTLKSLRF